MTTKSEVNDVLMEGYDQYGARRWWDRERVQLDGRTPEQAWVAGDKEAVLALAKKTVGA
jgi:hypothetical protein